jgi:hypothetical protein
MYRIEESRFISVKPLEIEAITITPKRAAKALPLPPNREVPPITAAAMAFRFTSPPPELWADAASRPAAKSPPTAPRVEAITNVEV